MLQKMPQNKRQAAHIQSLMPIFRNIEFFRDREIEDRTIMDIIATSNYEFIKKN